MNAAINDESNECKDMSVESTNVNVEQPMIKPLLTLTH